MCCACDGGSTYDGSYENPSDFDYSDSCIDTNNGDTDSYGYDCSYYAANPSHCSLFDTDTFSSRDMCCICTGGAWFSENSGEGTYGTVYDEDGTLIALWYLNQTDTEDGYWDDIYGETSGYWTYDADSTESGTWWHLNYTS